MEQLDTKEHEILHSIRLGGTFLDLSSVYSSMCTEPINAGLLADDAPGWSTTSPSTRSIAGVLRHENGNFLKQLPAVDISRHFSAPSSCSSSSVADILQREVSTTRARQRPLRRKLQMWP